MRGNVKDWTGKRVGDLTVVGFAGVVNKNSRWHCRCSCGNELIVAAPDLKRSKRRSCGCRKASWIAEARTIHGGAARGNHDPAYRCWRNMRIRCYDPKCNRFELYGGRGIAVCDRWLTGEGGVHPFDCFLQDMGPRPSPHHTVDRIDANGNYEPANCRWASPIEQGRNKRNNARFVWNGAEMSLAEICDIEGVRYALVQGRVKDGWDLAEAVRTPVRKHGAAA